MESAYPAALHPSHPWRTTGSCRTLEGEKETKLEWRMRKAAAVGKTPHLYVICRTLTHSPLTSKLVHETLAKDVTIFT